ncbi:4-hydroxy-tetrahydrodipicolinate synthase [Micrococcus luteus]|uniref:4-hydroxy-tetrahydrodipicolinate synthase n=1 Tax=Micrococcus luteus TaxID=1270 RepID=UPI00214FE9D1|nr:4-hydroxy-tetrahydrodipicolinate synthase [Micrococcus luteus]MCR4488021.1 4-hydroxy-tetrahydrodipicolinate synthase [Micrococcus luteus]MCV7506003.1 4-hydroxy-tetrahydrodipicolinate synthase [Micrococcus luteus]MCV7519082.1 4-hydroxy-tetrahydrodipicolinate synthase [Micrococcus luteus]MCV7568473.1 4-hydroxy-tetrahydrodipicolinate synthase [Micrococcus luteus]
MTTQLRGVLTALATPFTADGQVDVPTLRTLVDRSIDGGVDGVVACGSTGEFAALSSDERSLVIETVVEHTAGRVPVVAQTGATNTAEAISNSRHAQEVGADVLMLVTPYYEPLSLDETTEYIRTVAAAVDMPVMLYNIPAATGVNLDHETVGELARSVENIRYIKDSSANMEQANQLIHHHADHIGTFIGWDSLILSALTEGAAGVMAGAANVAPREIVAVRKAVLAGDFATARAEWERVYPLIDALISVPFIPAIKAALDVLGLPVGTPRRPTADLDPASRARIEQLIGQLELAPVTA